MVRLDLVDALTHLSFMDDLPADVEWPEDQPPFTGGVFSGLQVVERVTIPGADHSVAIAECEDRLRTLDFDAPDFTARQTQLLAERSRLQGLPAEPSRTGPAHRAHRGRCVGHA